MGQERTAEGAFVIFPGKEGRVQLIRLSQRCVLNEKMCKLFVFRFGLVLIDCQASNIFHNVKAAYYYIFLVCLSLFSVDLYCYVIRQIIRD